MESIWYVPSAKTACAVAADLPVSLLIIWILFVVIFMGAECVPAQILLHALPEDAKCVRSCQLQISSILTTEQLSCEDGLSELDDQVQVLSVVSAGAGLDRSDDAGAAGGAGAGEGTRWKRQSALLCCWGTGSVCSCFTRRWCGRGRD
ncbi:uncharacterized protein MONOS_6213 [Monocercomonoides exilis]|uniref:uncharacterized protein n=1 Tax=Monocercomonoides exilis TaxID=2049356 RepID=UPI00355A5B26|nr:hypothetical protein MONOS_6213 [Monocercomonoides exilis]|eukprot:MONOS_6213.1-p1 / transcript=MONOS_6213.1 / gene=MONOS_6213 / organism=Monocercomonoides_exilis_PA203 / gene_product=unspecified product / transcript_product=unspecified product / location=Mono_scaffold00193:3939-4382(-) / protein_length=148 / sequence_SO=supercontig / SO=protein_coding / is_pseudo=false